MEKALVTYAPVLHQGYLEMFERWKGATCFLVGEDLAEKYSDVNAKKEIRAINPHVMRELVRDLKYFKDVQVWMGSLPYNLRKGEVVIANDEICRRLAADNFVDRRLIFDSAFLRWDSTHVFSKKGIRYDRISRSKEDRRFIEKAEEEAKKTSDWWRAVGAIIVKTVRGRTVEVMSAYNRHVPSEYIPYVFGDPRDIIKAGEQSEIASAMHAEQVLIALAAESGIAFKGTDIYLTTFPCPLCAKLVAFSGIKRCFVKGGHASLDGESVLKSRKVEIILVK